MGTFCSTVIPVEFETHRERETGETEYRERRDSAKQRHTVTQKQERESVCSSRSKNKKRKALCVVTKIR